MTKIKELKNIIANEFARQYKSYELAEECKKYNIFPNEQEVTPDRSKRCFVLNGLEKVNDQDIWRLAKQILQDFGNKELAKQLEPYLGDDLFCFSHITRHKIVDFIEMRNNMEGNISIDDFLSPIWEMNAIYDLESGMTVADDIIYNREHNNESYKGLLIGRLEIQYISDEDFIKFLEILVHPKVRIGKDQEEYVKSVNEIIKTDGYQLQVSGNISGYPKYKVVKKNAINGQLKNLIFAPNGIKPDIVIEDTIENGIRVVGDTENCLKYDFEMSADGLKWLVLVDWWRKQTTDEKAEKSLYDRLYKSLDSDIEKFFMREYYRLYRNVNKKDIPALIPQVFLHYDPYTKLQRGNNIVFAHQRMDFLMLLQGGIRIVIELDGKLHYSDGEKASPKLYAELVKDTRDLQMKGYQVFRFGGYEFISSQNPQKMIEEFFEKLFDLYEVVI
ncbi:MAG: hypothetical protein NC331_06430 [Lachnospiraceae bacterium]|nr:hypothetical protein [Lachnospiraceae bacterium]MCM1239007.1 hypothetical protein [Lachnospiraceae bacterium]